MRYLHHYIRAIALSCLVSSSAVLALQSLASSPYNTLFPLENDITTANLMQNLHSLEKIADTNGGNRAFGTPGFAASRDFIVEQISKYSTVKAWTQDFPAKYTEVKSIALRVGETNYSINALTYSPSTSDEGIRAPLVLAPSGNVSCTAKAYEGLDIKGKIVLVERGKKQERSNYGLYSLTMIRSLSRQYYIRRPYTSRSGSGCSSCHHLQQRQDTYRWWHAHQT
jgi:hypothetical protein